MKSRQCAVGTPYKTAGVAEQGRKLYFSEKVWVRVKKKYLKVQHFLIHLKIETDFPNILFNSEERRIIGFDVPAWSRLFSYKGASRIALFLLHRSSPPKITIFVFIIFIRDHD